MSTIEKEITVSGVKILQITKPNNENVYYQLIDEYQNVNKQQFNLQEGRKLTYPDGAKMIHHKRKCLLMKNRIIQ